ncbi:MAG TPA: S9 family peptidase [Thermoanaerobaculia bacterium]|jgi:dipeptidyl aminopeptidase/acylaminoacyl peptidase|nr:S9 family peptidase [Thermoanaerobaculia bacterium]
MLKRSLPLLFTLLLASVVFAQKQPLTHETLYLMKRVGTPSISPDGKWVVFSVTEPSYDDKETVTDLWVAPTDGNTKPRKVTSMKAGESDPVWSPDGRRIAFSAKRDADEQAQIYILDLVGGGEAQRVTNLSTGVRSPKFSPDGKRLMFGSTVFPNAADDEANKAAAKEEKDRKFKVRAYDSFPIRAWDRWIDEKEPHLFVASVDGGKAKDLLAGTKLVAEAGFAGTGGGEGREVISGEWTPDGQSIVFTATKGRNTGAFAEVEYALYRVSSEPAREGGSSVVEPEVVASARGSYGNPSFSPDGKTLFATFEPNNGKTYNLSTLVAFDWPPIGGQLLNQRTVAQTDRSVGDYTVSSDGKTVYFAAEDSGLVKIYSVPAGGGAAKLAVDPQRGTYSGIVAAENAPVIVGRWGSSIDPNEVVRIDLTATGRSQTAPKHTNLTTFNVEQSRAIDWSAPEHFWFTSKRGRKIHNMIITPAGFDPSKKYPLFVLIHGGAHNMWQDAISLRWNYHLLAKPGYVMLLTNYTGSTGFGAEFAQLIQGDVLRGPAEELMEATDAAIAKYPFLDVSRQVAGGASYGGHLANALEAWSGNRFKALISHAGLVNLEAQWGTSDVIYGRELAMNGPVWEQNEIWRTQNPVRSAANFKTPMLLSVGEKDYRVPLNNTLEMWALLQRLRVPSRLLVWPEENHWILNAENSRVFYREVADWLAKWVKPGAM